MQFMVLAASLVGGKVIFCELDILHVIIGKMYCVIKHGYSMIIKVMYVLTTYT